MQLIDVIIPDDIWEADTEGVISSWFFENGESVRQGDILGEVMIEKTSFDLIAPGSGALTIVTPAESTVTKNQCVARIQP